MPSRSQNREVIIRHTFESVQDYTQIDGVILEAIVSCVMSAFDNSVTYENTLKHIKGGLITADVDQATERVLAFSSTDFGSPNKLFQRDDISGEEGCYLAGATVAKDAQGLGLYKSMNELRISTAIKKGLSLIFTRTQNPRVQAGIESTLDTFQKEGSILGYTHERILIPGCYGSQLTKTKPVDNLISYDELNYEEGDAYILMFKLIIP